MSRRLMSIEINGMSKEQRKVRPQQEILAGQFWNVRGNNGSRFVHSEKGEALTRPLKNVTQLKVKLTGICRRIQAWKTKLVK